MSDILKKAKSIEEFIIKFRRDLHKNPELSGEEYNTQAKIMSELDKLGIEYRNDEKEAIYFPNHEKFKIDEDYMKYGTALHVQFALDFLGR